MRLLTCSADLGLACQSDASACLSLAPHYHVLWPPISSLPPRPLPPSFSVCLALSHLLSSAMDWLIVGYSPPTSKTNIDVLAEVTANLTARHGTARHDRHHPCCSSPLLRCHTCLRHIRCNFLANPEPP